MTITFKYFGVVQEATQKEEEIVTFSENILSESKIRSWIENHYGKILTDNIRIAVNQNFVRDFKISEDAEIAFLPPFAGG
ncbi:MAG: MoaD/ThiS family protein [Cytophagaceae bacterium]|nr:MoaD/ThiS family protein [Cytophagaceae bacterium]MBK9935981.1 MoaD/ThiS family protein [Cytophagaceae bacterium]MBL0304135.1 MoaD/ThiS family protein [Cytophagaceae bacterium]MBL0326944.1 MoaD/ThiS family protein [Cytophagaceae bacterium]